MKVLVVALLYYTYLVIDGFIDYKRNWSAVDLIYENPVEMFSFSIVNLIDYQNTFKNDHKNDNGQSPR